MSQSPIFGEEARGEGREGWDYSPEHSVLFFLIPIQTLGDLKVEFLAILGHKSKLCLITTLSWNPEESPMCDQRVGEGLVLLGVSCHFSKQSSKAFQLPWEVEMALPSY